MTSISWGHPELEPGYLDYALGTCNVTLGTNYAVTYDYSGAVIPSLANEGIFYSLEFSKGSLDGYFWTVYIHVASSNHANAVYNAKCVKTGISSAEEAIAEVYYSDVLLVTTGAKAVVSPANDKEVYESRRGIPC